MAATKARSARTTSRDSQRPVRRTAARKRATVDATPGYPYRVNPWEAPQNRRDRGPEPPGLCESCWRAGYSDHTTGMPYAIPENGEWAEYIVTLCPDCLACHVITDGEVYDFRRFPQSLIIREPNGRFMQSQRRIIVRREPDRSIYLLAIKTTGDALPTVLLPKESAEWQVREAYAKVLRSLDTADPIPPFVPHPPHEARELKLAK